MSSPGTGIAMVTVGRTLSCEGGIATELNNATTERNNAARQHAHIVRCFMHKLVQVVVQSRYGSKPNLQDNAPGWELVGQEQELQHVAGLADSKFHLDILDSVEVTDQFQKIVRDWTLTPGNAFTVQILIHTVDGELFVMEMWSLVMSESPSSAPSRHNDTSQLYAKFSSLLKSVLVSSRITPGYQMSFQQSPKTYVMFYTLTMALPNFRHLGTGYAEHFFPPVSCLEGQYRLEVRYRTNYTRDLDFNCSILHRDMYYSSLASLNDAAVSNPSTAVPPQRLCYHSSDRHLDRCCIGGGGGAATGDRHYVAGETYRGYQQPPPHQHQYHQLRNEGTQRQLQFTDALPTNERQRRQSQPQQQPKSPTRRISIGTMRRPEDGSAAAGEVECSSLPTRMGADPHPLSHIPGQQSPSSRASPPVLTKSPPTAIPKPPQSNNPAASSSYSPFDGVCQAPPPDAYVVPRVTLPPGDLFASIVHGTNTADTDVTQLSTSFVASDDEDSGGGGDDDRDDCNTTPPEDLLPPAGATTLDRRDESAGGDYVLVDNPPAFLDNRSPQCELGYFYYACRNAPRLFTSTSIGDIPQGCATVAPAGGGRDASDGGSLSSRTDVSASPRSGSYSTSGGSSHKFTVAPPRSGGVVVQGKHVDQEELFSQRKPNSFAAETLLQDKYAVPFEQRLKQFEDNLGQFNSLVESLHSSSDLEPT